MNPFAKVMSYAMLADIHTTEEDWVAAAQARADYWAWMQSQDLSSVVCERPKADCAVNLDRRADWPIVEGVLQDAVTLATTDDWGVVYPTHDPTCKSPEERAWERWLLSTVLDTGWVAPQLRDPVGRALLRTIEHTSQAPQAVCCVYDLVQLYVAPWLFQPLPPRWHAHTVRRDPSTTEAISATLQELLTDLEQAVYMLDDSNTPVLLQIGEHQWSFPVGLLNHITLTPTNPEN